jgi:transposase-like protein
MADMVANGNSTRGEKNARAILTEDSVREIKQRLQAGESVSALAREFNVAQPTISNIKTGTTWSYI